MASGIPPYVAYRTFENFLAELRARGLPSRIDRSILSHKSGTVQSQLLLCLQYLDLLTASGRPTGKLRGWVTAEGGARKSMQREIIKSAYDFVFDSNFDLNSATLLQMEELFQQTGASGETVRRCIGFFLAAAKSAGIPFSAYLKPYRGKKGSLKHAEAAGKEPTQSLNLRSEATQAIKIIQLRSGGILTLELSFDPFKLDKSDRQFVFDLIDRLNQYPQESGS